MPGAAWELSEGDELVTIRTQAVRVALRRTADRWIHEVGPADGPPWLATIEDPPESADPSQVVSPVYQEVQHHSFDDDDRRVRLLLTGLLHKHHFSAVLTVQVDDDGATVVDLDVADRCRDVVSRLAATYEVRLGPGDLEDAGPRAVAWSLGDATLALAAVDGAGLATASKGPRSVQVQALASLTPGAFTHRLRYRWTWATRSGRTR
ncbi:MAG: hypothetical protein BGO49_03145 [Planctomycetales bacterium 71-10]|nr:MAG: hypothetical protein BGO49_03145 [Planctomycetales bacterium 71-10]